MDERVLNFTLQKPGEEYHCYICNKFLCWDAAGHWRCTDPYHRFVIYEYRNYCKTLPTIIDLHVSLLRNDKRYEIMICFRDKHITMHIFNLLVKDIAKDVLFYETRNDFDFSNINLDDLLNLMDTYLLLS